MNNNSWMMEAKKNSKNGRKGRKVDEKSVEDFLDRRAKQYKECFALTHPKQVVLVRDPHHGGTGRHLSVLPTF